ncbi:MAG TPA: pyruvate kinase [Miltoncostaeaceae bacterium]|nr:pyruvate kinase [Miltoncostaeaceae bacterium]
MQPVRRTKIVATIGPASRDPSVLEALIDAGMNVARLNFSHGSRDDHQATVTAIREISRRKGVAVGILQDLQGPKIRTGRFANGPIQLIPGHKFIITAEDVPGDENRVSTTLKSLPEDVRPGLELLLADGNLALRVDAVRGPEIHTTVTVGGELSNNKGINIPGADLSVPALSDKDIEDLQFGTELGVDWLAVSFVRSRDDLLLARHYLTRYGSRAKLMAKIEKPTAVERFHELLAEADGIMVARGDLGVELPSERVPVIQKRLIGACQEAGKPVITATQMLESMITNPRPTRAEASDVANAIFDGTDAVMLSAESAAGKYPVEAVRMMDRIARNTEASPEYQKLLLASLPPLQTTQDAVALAACEISQTLEGATIVCFTATGSTVWRVSRNRPQAVVAAFTPNERVRDQLTLAWGVVPRLAEDPRTTDDMVRIASQSIREAGLADTGDRIVMTAGVPFGMHGTTNLIRVERVG